VYLADTNILSAWAPTLKQPPAELVSWLDSVSEGLFISVVTAAEVRAGIAKLERKGATSKASALRGWWLTVEHLYGARILPFDLPAAQAAASLLDRAREAGADPGFADVAIAATAHARGLTLLTRNAKDFAPMGVDFLDPYERLPTGP